MRRLSVFVKKFLGDRLISEEKEKMLIFMADQYRLISLPWWRSHDRAWRLSTPYGKLAIWGFDAGTRVLQRQRADLVHSICHVSDGFHGSSQIVDGCCWDMRHSTCSTTIPTPAPNPNNGEILPDSYEVERDALNDHLKDVLGLDLAADDNLLADIRAAERTWSLRPPQWTTLSVGQHILATPCGVLKVVRFYKGWSAHRDGEQLSWFRKEVPVVFARLQDAKTAALLHTHDYRDQRFVDGTHWWSCANQ